MSDKTQRSEAKRTYSLLVPIYNLQIGSDIGSILRVGDVRFVSADKLPKIRRHLGLPETVSAMRRKAHWKRPDFSSLAPTYAHLKTLREPKATPTREFRRVRHRSSKSMRLRPCLVTGRTFRSPRSRSTSTVPRSTASTTSRPCGPGIPRRASSSARSSTRRSPRSSGEARTLRAPSSACGRT